MNLVKKIIIGIEQRLAPIFLRKRAGVVMLCFHDICINNYSDRYSIKLNDFKRIVSSIEKDIISIEKIPQYINSKKTKYVISFDDGYDSLYKYALSYLKDQNIPFVSYICTDYIGRVGYLSKNQILEMALYRNCTIGSHMCSHSKTRDLGYKKTRREWMTSKKIIETMVDKKIYDAALPYGSIPACSLGSIILAFISGYRTVATTIAYSVRNRKLLSRVVYDNESTGLFLKYVKE